jgi:hypothetical protein
MAQSTATHLVAMRTSKTNASLHELALMFLGRLPVEREIPFVESLDRAALDGSISSLGVVDDYLLFVHENLWQLTESECSDLALRCGAYVGECIRMTWPGQYDWMDYDDYVPLHPEVAKILPERVVGTCALLLRNPDGFLTPVDKVLSFMHDGPASSVHYFATCEHDHHKRHLEKLAH